MAMGYDGSGKVYQFPIRLKILFSFLISFFNKFSDLEIRNPRMRNDFFIPTPFLIYLFYTGYGYIILLN